MKTLADRPRDEAGSALLDVILGMAIAVLLAVIAVGSFSSYRDYEDRRATEADAVRVVSALLSDGAAYRTYPASLSSGAGELDVRLAPDNYVRGYVRHDDPRGFTLCVVHTASGSWALATHDEGVTASGTGSVPLDACGTGGVVDTAYYR